MSNAAPDSTPASSETPAPEETITQTPVPEHGISWGIKQSFLRYLTGTGGQITVEGGVAIADGEFHFPLADASAFDVYTASGTLRCGGSVRFFGHFGALDLTLADPWLEVDEQGAVVSFDTGVTGRIPLIVLGSAETGVEGGVIVWRNIQTRLLPDGDIAFNGVYGTGEQFDPLTIRIPEPA